MSPLWHIAPSQARKQIEREGLRASNPGDFVFSEGPMEKGTPRVYMYDNPSAEHGIPGDLWEIDDRGLPIKEDERSGDGSYYHEGDISPMRLRRVATSDFDPDTITQEKLHELRRAAEHAWSDETRPEDSRGHPQPSAGHCYVTSKWLQGKLGGGHVGQKDGHFFWVSPDKNYVVDLTGDQTAYGRAKWAAEMQDADDEPYEHEPEQMRHRPGPVIYTHATNPLYRDFRIQSDPQPGQDKRDWEDLEQSPSISQRSQLFAERANAALEGKLTRQADAGGAGSDAYPAEGPQAEEEFNQRDFHDPVIDDLNLSMEEPVEHEYRFMFANGEFKVSPTDDYETMAQEAGISGEHEGPVAVGYVNVRGREALWSVETNVGLRGLVKMMKDYSKQVGWKWGGLVDGSGQPVADDFGAKKSFWYGYRDGKLKLSGQPFWGSFDEIEVVGRTAHFNRSPNQFARPGLEEWAKDFGYRIAEYPGGTDMNDRVKNKEWPTTYDKGDPEADPGKAFDGEPQGDLSCPYCNETLPDFKAYVMHTQDHQDPKAAPIDDGHFPTIEDSDTPLPLRPRNVTPTAIPVMGSMNPWKFAPPDGRIFEADATDPRVRCPHCGKDSMVRRDRMSNGVPFTYGFCESCGMNSRWPSEGEIAPVESPEHPDPWMDAEPGSLTFPDSWRFEAAAGKEGKDLLQAPIPFIYDIEKDYITVGHPGMRTPDIMGQFTPGGIVEGYYEPKGKMVINTTTTIPFSTYHMMQLWYYSHPGLEITSLEMESQTGEKHKVASADVGTYIRSITAADGAAWTASQALKEAGGKVYVVGGAVRDALLQKEPKDIDLMVSGIPPEDVNNILEHLPGRVDLTGKRFGVYRYHTKGQEVEIALPRTDTYDQGGTRGQGQITVDHNLPVEKDLQRRDFTANSMAVDLDSGRLVDPYGGARDLESHALRTTHPGSFDEDPTRLVRALTMHSRHGLVPDEQTRKEMEEHAPRLDQESPDALKQQLEKFLVSQNPAGGIRLAHETGVLKHLFPELESNFYYDQKNPHHTYTLGEHSLNVLDNISRHTKDPDLRLAALLHDMGKPASAWEDPVTGATHYYAGMLNGQPVGADHAKVGADLAEARLRQTFNYPISKIRNIHNLINSHMWSDFSSPKGARKFLQKHGDSADDLLTLREADTAGKGGISNRNQDTIERQRELVEQARSVGAATNQSSLSVNGNDLLALGLKGPQIGIVLRQLTNDVVADQSLNDRARLLERAQEYANAQSS
jgi:tRNA nucleotidyltransferase (CCA-adding enzyme)